MYALKQIPRRGFARVSHLASMLTLACQIAVVPALAQPLEISQADEHADSPAAAFAPNGDLWVTWTAYDGRGSDLIKTRRRTGSQWHDIETVSPRAGDFLKTSIAIRPDGRVWIAWSAQVNGNFDLYSRTWHDGRWDPVIRLTSDPQPDIHHSLQADSDGRLHLVWQSFRTGDANIYLKTHDGYRWSAPIAVTTHEANDWEPSTALDDQDRLYVVYDSYRHGDYDVMLRVLEGSELSEEHPIADSPDFEARASIAIDGEGRAWIAWDDQGPNWALDMPSWDRSSQRGDWGEPAPWSVEGSVGQLVSLRYTQKIGVAVFAGGQRWTPTGSLEDAMSDQFALSFEIPQMTIDPSGNPRLFLRRWEPRNDGSGMKERPAAWNVHAMTYSGSEWSSPVMLEGSSGSNDQRVAVATNSEGSAWVAYPSDDRWIPGGPVVGQPGRAMGKIRVMSLAQTEPDRPALERMAGSAVERPYASTAWSDRRHTVAAGERRYSLYWGDLHRHTEISGDGGFDGTLWDMYRYALDAAELDFIASTDHFYGGDGEFGKEDGRTYDWWRTQKLADAFHVRGRFAPLFGYSGRCAGHMAIAISSTSSGAPPRLEERSRETKKIQNLRASPTSCAYGSACAAKRQSRYRTRLRLAAAPIFPSTTRLSNRCSRSIKDAVSATKPRTLRESTATSATQTGSPALPSTRATRSALSPLPTIAPRTFPTLLSMPKSRRAREFSGPCSNATPTLQRTISCSTCGSGRPSWGTRRPPATSRSYGWLHAEPGRYTTSKSSRTTPTFTRSSPGKGSQHSASGMPTQSRARATTT